MKVTPRIRRRGSAIGLRRRPFPSSAHGSSPSFPRRSSVRPKSSPPAVPVTRQVSPMLISLRQAWLPYPSRAYGVWHPFDSSSQRQSYLGNGRKIHMGSSPGSFEGGWTLPGDSFCRLARNTGLCRVSTPCPPRLAGLYRENWTLPGRYPKSRLMAPRDGAMRAGIGGFDGFRMMPVAPSRATSASG
jgi:hypothetical protein